MSGIYSNHRRSAWFKELFHFTYLCSQPPVLASLWTYSQQPLWILVSGIGRFNFTHVMLDPEWNSTQISVIGIDPSPLDMLDVRFILNKCVVLWFPTVANPDVVEKLFVSRHFSSIAKRTHLPVQQIWTIAERAQARTGSCLPRADVKMLFLNLWLWSHFLLQRQQRNYEAR